MTKFYTRAITLLIITPVFFFGANAQTYSPGKAANFGVDGDILSGQRLVGSFDPASSDDWFYKGQASNSGRGIIDTTGTASLKSLLVAGSNSVISKRMAYYPYTIHDGRLFMDGMYFRDNIGLSGSVKDSTVFTNGAKNGTLPTSWGTNVNGSTVIDKTDLVDGYAHMRRDGIISTGSNPDHLIMVMGASTMATAGVRYLDLELFRSPITYSNVTGLFSNSGPASTGGHTDWTFNSNGTVTKIGDMDFSFSFSSSEVSEISVYIWTARTTVENIVPTGFDFVGISEFYGDGQNAAFGYAKIIRKNNASLPVWGSVNTSATDGPGWGTTSKDLGQTSNNYYSTQYAIGQFAEIGVDLTVLGVDLGSSLGSNPCEAIFTKLIIKSRSSASFTSALSDFAGPYAFLDGSQISPSIIAPQNLTCVNSTVTLQPQINTPGYIYYWTTADGSIISNPDTAIITVNTTGRYYLHAAVSAYCLERIDSVDVRRDTFPPIASGDVTGAIYASSSTANILGGNEAASNYPTPFGGSQGLLWNWSGPMGYTSVIRDNAVAVEGSYTLIVTEIRNGCKDTVTVYVPSALLLSVNVIDFEGSYKNGSALLKWNATSPADLVRFEIEKSIDGNNFRKIGQSNVNPNANNISGYSFVDAGIVKTNFYRLKVIESNGKSSYSKVVMITTDNTNADAFLVYPNPFGNTVQIRLENKVPGHGLVRLINIEGKVVKMQVVSLQSGTNNIQLNDFSFLPCGNYFIEVSSDSGIYKTKIIKQ